MNARAYAEYLNTQHWRKLSERIRRARGVCERCKIDASGARRRDGQPLNVHHIRYERLGRELETDLALLCWRCHMTEHGLGGWIDFCQSKAMPRVQAFRLSCANCGAVNGPVLYNADEMTEWLCRECR